MSHVFKTSLAVLAHFALAAEVPPDGSITNAELLGKLREVTQEFERYKAQSTEDFARLEALVRESSEGHEEEADAPKQNFRASRGGRGGQRQLKSERRLAVTSAQLDDVKGAMNHMWLIICGALVMFMQAGFAMVEAGCCRVKNVQNILLKNLTDVCAGTLCWWSFGWMFAYGPIEGLTKFAGNNEFFGHDFHIEPRVGVIVTASGNQPLNWFFQWAFCSAAATIVSGGIAERVNFPSYLLYTVWMTTIIYPVVVAWTWSGTGWLQGGTEQQINSIGYYDFAGSGIVHMCGGVGALTAAAIVGPRNGRFDGNDEGAFDPHSLPLIVLGTFILWFGWYGFNCGSTLGMADTATGQLAATVAMNTTISAATGGLTVLALRLALFRKYDIGGMCNGILAGLVSITAPCGNVESGSAFVIGMIGALIYQGASSLLRMLKIDDPIDAFPVHGAAGIWGTLAAVIFDWGDGIGIFHGWNGFTCNLDATGAACATGARTQAFVANLVGLIAIASWTALLSVVMLVPLKLLGVLRAPDEVQEAGADQKKHSPTKAYNLQDESAVERIDVAPTKVVPS